MKWFKHESDAHMNLKLQAIIDKFGLVAFGYYWVIVELVANQGTDYCLKKDKEWSTHLKKFINLDVATQKKYLFFFAEKGLIDKAYLMKGDLYIPKLKERSDEYTQRVRSKSGQYRDSVGLEEKRIDKKRREEKPTAHVTYLKNIPKEDMEEFRKRFDVSQKSIESKAESFLLYCNSKGKTYKDYKSALLNAMKKDFPERKVEYSPSVRVEENIEPKEKVMIPQSLKDEIKNIVGNKTIK